MSRTSTNYDYETREAALALLELERLRLAKVASKPIWTPQPGAQEAALYDDAHELFYGGAAGGGKTDLLIGASLTVHWKSIIFRRVYPQLKDILARSREIISSRYPKARYNSNDHLWSNMPSDRTLEFGAIQFLKDRESYQGRPHDLKGFDEITQFLREQYTYVIGWNRTTRPNQIFRAICTGNPPTTPEGQWVIDYWAPWLDRDYKYPAAPLEKRWFATIDGESVELENGNNFEWKGQLIEPRSRTFLPARLADNPILQSTGYGSVINNMPEPLRSQLLFGDFDIEPDSDPWQVIPSEWLELAGQRWREYGNTMPSLVPSSLGIDVARGGKDRTAVFHRHHNWFSEPFLLPGADSPNGDAVAEFVLQTFGIEPDPVTGAYDIRTTLIAEVPMNIDIIGVGSAVADALARIGCTVYDVHGNAGTTATDFTSKLHILNLRAEMYWKFRELLDPRYGAGLMIPPLRELFAELTAARWHINSKGYIQVDEKEDVKERLGRSPDLADALVMSALDMSGRRGKGAATSHSYRSYGNTLQTRAPEQPERRSASEPLRPNYPQPTSGSTRIRPAIGGEYDDER